MNKEHKFLCHPHPKREFCYWCNPVGYAGMGADAMISESWTRERLKEYKKKKQENDDFRFYE